MLCQERNLFFTCYVKRETCFLHGMSREKHVFHMLYQERNMFCACCIREKQSFAVTTRERKPFEEDGKEYHFLTREEMEEEIISQR